jgi:hypothetical protein
VDLVVSVVEVVVTLCVADAVDGDLGHAGGRIRIAFSKIDRWRGNNDGGVDKNLSVLSVLSNDEKRI